MKSIRNRMMATLITSTLCIFGVVFVLSQITLASLPAMTKKQYSEIVAARSDEVSSRLKGMVEQLTIISQSPVVRSMDLDAMKEYLPQLVLTGYRNITIGYPDGTAWSTVNMDIDIKDQQQYADIFLDRKKYSISQPFLSSYIYEPNLPIVTIAHEVLNRRNEVIGLVNFVVPVRFLNQIVSELRLTDGGYGWIMNQDGLIVAHQDSSIAYYKTISDVIEDSDSIKKLFSSDSGSFEYEKVNGEKMIAFYDRIENSPGWIFVVSINQNAVYRKVNEFREIVLAGLIITLILTITYAYFFSGKLTKPIFDFISLFDQAAAGNLNVRAKETYQSEFSVAASTFNTMLERIKTLTYQDVTTYLYNYNGFLLELPQRVKDMIKQHLIMAIVIISIDDFKRINSINGYQVGDEVLRRFSQKLLIQMNGNGMAARLFGDEFILLIGGISPTDIERKVQALWEVSSGEIQAADNSFILHASIGASMLTDYAVSIEQTIHEATVAKLIVKKEGGNAYRFYNEDLDLLVKQEQRIETALFHALESNELYLAYQPIIDVRTNRIIGNESLLRWNHPEFKTISIQKVIEQAEQSGMIVEIGKWILTQACIQNKKWQDTGNPGLIISVNVSALQFDQENFVDMVSNILKETQMDPRTLELEITENIAMEHVEEKLHKMSLLQKMGVRIALDDFGTGYSSLAYISRFPIDTLKIDRSFTKEIFGDEHAKSVITSIINLAKSTGITTTAEGVESKQQFDYLKQLDCDKIQGYFISKPTAPEIIEAMLKKYNVH